MLSPHKKKWKINSKQDQPRTNTEKVMPNDNYKKMNPGELTLKRYMTT